jgi:predicted enzyme related to lactoylglutathione lyase
LGFRDGAVDQRELNMNTIGYFEIQSSDPKRDIRFYEAVFGWKFFKDGHMPIEYYRIETNSINGGLLKRPAQIAPSESGTNAFVCSVQVKSFDEINDRIIQSGGQVALPKFAVPGRCWQGYFLDLDNNTFGIFEVDEHAK